MSMFDKVKWDSRLSNRYELNNEQLSNRHDCQNNLADQSNSFISVEIVVLQFLSLIAKYNIIV